MTLASILVPHWVTMDVPVHDSDKTYSQHLGLHHYCNTALPDKPCRFFPEEEKDCMGDEKHFCSMWRTTGFLMSFATVAELATLVCFVVTIGGGKVKREYGWKVLCSLLALVSVVQFAAMGLVVGHSPLAHELMNCRHPLPGCWPKLTLFISSPSSSTTTSTFPYRAGDSTPHIFCALSVQAFLRS